MFDKKAFYILLLSLFFIAPTYALDWQALHQKAAYTKLEPIVQMVKKNPNNLENMYLLGLSYLNNNEPDKAEIVFKELLALYPDTFEARWGLSEVANRKGDFTSTEKEVEAIVKDHPEFLPAQISLAYIKFGQNDYDKTLEITIGILTQGKAIVGDDAYRRAFLLFLAARGVIASNGGPLVKFIYSEDNKLAFKAAENYMPQSAQMYFGVGSFLLLSPPSVGGNLERAQDYLRAAIKVNPKFADSYVRLAQVYKIRGDQNGFERYLNKALKIDPQNKIAQETKEKISHFTCVLQ